MFAACSTPQEVGVLPTEVVLPSLTSTLTPTVTLTGTQTATNAPTLSPTPTASPTETLTPTISVTPSATITETSTPTPTITPSPSPSVGPLSILAQLAANATPIPQTFLPPVSTAAGTLPASGIVPSAPGAPVTCTVQPSGGFGTAYASDLSLNTLIGCAQGTPTAVNSALQVFERGSMIWLQGPIYVLYNDGRFQRYEDTYVAGVDPESGGEVPPAGLIEPVRGFGKVWRSNADVRNGLGWGITQETGNQATQQRFDRGWMIYLPQRGDIVVLDDVGSTWRVVAGTA